MGKDSEGSGRGLILMYCSSIRLEALRKTMRNFRQDSRFRDQDLNPTHAEYEGVLTTRPRRSVPVV
jgi:hypothetical protein